jgi:hypothetical protein
VVPAVFVVYALGRVVASGAPRLQFFAGGEYFGEASIVLVSFRCFDEFRHRGGVSLQYASYDFFPFIVLE